MINKALDWLYAWGKVVVLMVVVSAATTVALHRYAPLLSGSPNSFVVFDVVKFANAERAVASRMLSQAQRSYTAAQLAKIQSNTRAVIEKFAHGRTVIMKQALVGSKFPDITDDVLNTLGLPTTVPTQLPADFALNASPSQFMAPSHRATGPVSTPATGDANSSMVP